MAILPIKALRLIEPEWVVTPGVEAYTTTRHSGVSQGKYASFNLATHVEDDPQAVSQNRHRLKENLNLPSEPFWLNQQHTTDVVTFAPQQNIPIADAAWTQERGRVLTVMTADCLPVLLVDKSATTIAAIHAGWRGLADGIIEKTLNQLPVEPGELQAWIGPAISQAHFEVGGEVLDAFVEKHPAALDYFKQSTINQKKYFADLPSLADFILKTAGVRDVTFSHLCSYEREDLFYSYRRDGQTGRMASLIWLE